MSAPTTITPEIDPTSYRGMVALALPLILSMAANSLMLFTDRYFLSLLGPQALAASMPAGITAYTLQCLFAMAAGYTATFASQYLGAGEPQRCGAWIWPALWISVLGGLVSLSAIPFLPTLFSLTDREAPLVHDMTALCSWYLGNCLPATVLAGVNGFYSGLGRTPVVMALSLTLLVLNAALNYGLIFGHLGLPELGLVGSGVGTLIAISVMAMVALALVFSPHNRRTYGTWNAPRWSLQRLAHFARFAAPQSVRTFIEVGAWGVFTFVVGRFGLEALVANNIVISWNLLTVIPMIGLSQAVSVAVGREVGAQRIALAVLAARRGFHLQLIFAGSLAVLFVVRPDLIMAPFLHDQVGNHTGLSPTLIPTVYALLMIAAISMLGDAVNFTYSSALSGAGDTRWPLLASCVATLGLLVMPLITMTLVQSGTWERLGIVPVIFAWSWTLVFVFGIGAVMVWRFQCGAWKSMTVREHA